MLCVSSISETAEDAVCFDCSTAAWVVSCSSRSVRVMVFEALCVAISAVSRSSLIERVTASLEAALADVWLDLQLLERPVDGAGPGLARLVDQARDLLAVVHHGLGEV